MSAAVQSEVAPAYVPAPSRYTEAERAIIEQASAILERGLKYEGVMTDPVAAGRFLASKLRDRPNEVFAVLFLDTRHRLLAYEELFQGSVDGCEVNNRLIAIRALAHNAAAVILAHNHPSGHPEPSAADRAVTDRIKQVLKLLDVRLLDHFIVGDGPAVSMAARGWV